MRKKRSLGKWPQLCLVKYKVWFSAERVRGMGATGTLRKVLKFWKNSSGQ